MLMLFHSRSHYDIRITYEPSSFFLCLRLTLMSWVFSLDFASVSLMLMRWWRPPLNRSFHYDISTTTSSGEPSEHKDKHGGMHAQDVYLTYFRFHTSSIQYYKMADFRFSLRCRLLHRVLTLGKSICTISFLFVVELLLVFWASSVPLCICLCLCVVSELMEGDSINSAQIEYNLNEWRILHAWVTPFTL